ncbi:hypothetical protein AKJ09_11228 [Labilithrix luteola]|uniref:Uncharacterized protein n=1 Tax=Labilithrix luteola TaxID=1391654 RepID=A0A0K1QGK3_9BACT|nr:hypothetical protein AKJ09_11228 [Labilithrix luteola]
MGRSLLNMIPQPARVGRSAGEALLNMATGATGAKPKKTLEQEREEAEQRLNEAFDAVQSRKIALLDIEEAIAANKSNKEV